MVLVAGVDTSTQSCKIVIVDAESSRLARQGVARHPEGTEVEPHHWWEALQSAVEAAGGLGDVAALAVAGQQHGMICLDEHGDVIRPALLWNDIRSASAAADLVVELGAATWADAVGSVPVASYTATKLRWLADHEPDNAARIAAIALPHDWLTWKLAGARSLDDLATDRSDASGTGHWSPASGEHRRDLLELALRRSAENIVLPTVLGPRDTAGRGDQTAGIGHLVLGPGCGDSAGAALGLGLADGDVTPGHVGSVS
jgi:xylulokinase